MKQKWFTGMSLLCVALLTCGCPPKKPPSADGEDILDPEIADTPLDPRWVIDEGARVHDVEFDVVFFRYDNYQIDMDQVLNIEAVAEFMRGDGAVRLVTEGHCDERGSREYNLSLGDHRAQAVRAYLISLGVEGERIQTRSYGEEEPRNTGHSESAWRANRRVEFALYR